MEIEITINSKIEENEVVALYRLNGWSSADKPDKLIPALENSHTLVVARVDGDLVGIGNSISDGHLVVYYPHILVHPEYQRLGIGRKIMAKMNSIYGDFHQQILAADGEAINFYKSLGFVRAGETESMWIYDGADH